MDTNTPIKKKTFKDKIKDRVSIVKQKSSDTHLNARSNVGHEKHSESIDFRHCVESLLPQLHHENEIKKALLENMVELRVKEASHVRREQRKIEDDFFLLVSKPTKEINQSKSKKKSKVSTSPSAGEVTSQKEDGDKDKTLISSSKTALNYFDTELNDHNMVTSLIISKSKFDIDANSLFWDGQEKLITNIRSRNKLEEGFFVGSKPKSRSNHLRGILSQSDDQSEWFGSDGELILEDNPVCEENSEIKYIPVKEVELLTSFVKPIFFKENIKNSSPLDASNELSHSVIELDFSTLKFFHHPLFSVEHIIARKVTQAYDVYVKKQSEKVIKQQDELLSSLRRTKESIEQKILSENDNNHRKLYNDQNLRKYIKEISKIRKSRFDAALEQKNLEKEILKLWRNMKYIRRQLKYTSTSLILEIIKIEVDVEEDRKNWEDNFEMEVNDIIAELRCEYFELKMEYIKKTKISKKSSPDTSSDKSQKPHLEYDEVKIRKNLFNEMCKVFRQPGEPIISFKLSRSPTIITEVPDSLKEVNRRADVDKTKMCIKIFIDNKEICKTKTISLNHDFELNIEESFSIHLPKEAASIKLVVLEQTSFLPPNSVGEISVAIPKNHILLSDVKMEDFSFLMRNKRNFKHNGAGSHNTLSELLKAKYSQLIVHNLDLEELMICEGSVRMKFGWTTNSEGSFNLTQLHTNLSNKEIPSSEVLSKLFDTLLDPNDPKNTFLFTYLKKLKDKPESSDKFYLNFFLNFDFFQMRNSETFTDANLVNKNNIKDLLASNLQMITNEEASTSAASKPRGSVLDDSSILNKILDPIDLQRRTSIRYLQLVYEHLSLQSNVDKKDKQLSDIVTEFKYPGLRTITVNFLRPKRPLFYQTRQPNISLIAHKVDTARNYTLKICILKAFQLPCRSEGTQAGTSTDTEEGGLKMMSLKPFVRVTCQGRSLRTSTAMGNNPTWNEQLCFPVRYDSSSVISFHLFDEIFEDLLSDDRLENTTVHCQYSANWLGSMKISLTNVFSQAKIEGTLLMYSPPEMLGYKQNLEEKYAHSHVSYDSLRRDTNSKQREGFNISMFLEIFPTYSDVTPPIEILETNEMDYMIKHLNNFTESYKNSFPNRTLHLLVLDTSGKYICITRLFKSLPLPEFGDNLNNLIANSSHYEESVSSKSSTPNRKKSSKNQNNDDAGTRSTKSVISTNVGDGRRHSKSTKDAFEMKSLNENVTDNVEKNLLHRLQICTRFVAMIPLFELNTLGSHYVALSGYQTLRLVCGSMMDHTTLLMNYFMHLGVDCWYVSGLALPRGLSTYVLVRENKHTNEMGMKEGPKSYARLSSMNTKNVWKYLIYDATTGIKYDTKDPFCPLQKVYSVCNSENIWANVQVVERCNLTKFDFNVTSEWRPVFQKDHLISCPGPLPTLSGMEESLYSYSAQDVQRLRDAIEDKLKSKIQRWRGHRRTTWNRHCSSILKNTLVHWEKWSLNQSSPKPKNSPRLQQLLLSYQIYGFPFNSTYTSMGDIISAMKATQIHLNENTSTEFALGVEIFPYPNRIYSTWIYLASITKK